MHKFAWLGLGVVGGFVLAGVVGVVAVDLIVPWEEVCAVVGPTQQLAETGSKLLTQLEDWLLRAESFLTTVSPEEEAGETRTGLAGVVDKARQITGGAADAAVDLVTLPLRALIDLAKIMLVEVQAVVDAARNVLASVDAARCD